MCDFNPLAREGEMIFSATGWRLQAHNSVGSIPRARLRMQDALRQLERGAENENPDYTTRHSYIGICGLRTRCGFAVVHFEPACSPGCNLPEPAAEHFGTTNLQHRIERQSAPQPGNGAFRPQPGRRKPPGLSGGDGAAAVRNHPVAKADSRDAVWGSEARSANFTRQLQDTANAG